MRQFVLGLVLVVMFAGVVVSGEWSDEDTDDDDDDEKLGDELIDEMLEVPPGNRMELIQYTHVISEPVMGDNEDLEDSDDELTDEDKQDIKDDLNKVCPYIQLLPNFAHRVASCLKSSFEGHPAMKATMECIEGSTLTDLIKDSCEDAEKFFQYATCMEEKIEEEELEHDSKMLDDFKACLMKAVKNVIEGNHDVKEIIPDAKDVYKIHNFSAIAI